MKYLNKLKVIFLPVLILFAAIFLYSIPFTAHAMYSASDDLGQSGSLSPGANFSSNLVNASPGYGMQQPFSSTLDAVDHLLFVADTGNNRILVYTLNTNNQPTSPAQSYVLGQKDFILNHRNQGGSVSSTTLANPSVVTVDPTSHMVYVDDSANSRVLVYDISGGVYNDMPAKYVLGQSNFTSSSQNQGGSVSSASLSYPYGVTLDPVSHLLYITDTGNCRVLVYDMSGGITNGMSAKYVLGQTNFTSKSQNQGGSVSSTTLAYPNEISVDATSHMVYVDDYNNNRVLAYDMSGGITNGMPAKYVFGQSNFTSSGFNQSGSVSSTTLGGPTGVTLDPVSHLLYITDTGNSRVLIYDISGGITNNMPAKYVLGQTNFTSNGYNTSSTTLSAPYDASVDATSHMVYVDDYGNNRVLVYDISGGITNGMPASYVLGQTDGVNVFFDTGGTNYFPLGKYGMNYPRGVALDPIDHYLFVSDCFNNRILIYNLNSSNQLTHRYADYVIGQPDFTSNSQNQGGSVSSTTVAGTYGISVDTTSHLVYVTDPGNSRVLVYDISGGITNNMPAKYVLGQPNFTSSSQNQGGSVSSTSMARPTGVVIDHSSQMLFITDPYDNRVLVYDISGGITNGMSAKYVLGQTNFTSKSQNQGGSVSSTTMSNPYGISYDSALKRLFIDDDYNNRALVFDLSNGISNDMPAKYVLGQTNFTTVNSSNTTASSSTGYFAEELAYDSNHDALFIGDDNSNRIIYFDLSKGITNGMAASAVIGQVNFTSNDYSCTPSADTICNPDMGMYYDTGNNSLWMTDDSNNRVLYFEFIKLPNQINTGTVNSSYSGSVSASNYQGTPSYTIATGTLPTGLTLNPNTGVISGTPTVIGSSTFTIKAVDDIGSQGSFTDTKSYTITVSKAPVVVTPSAPVVSVSSSSGGSVSTAVLSTILAPSAAAKAYLATRSTIPDCPQGYVCTPSQSPSNVEIPTQVPTVDLGLGNNSISVKHLQEYLNSQGYTVATSGPGSSGDETTYFGLLTKQALAKYQRDHNINPASGYYGPITEAYINSHLSMVSPSTSTATNTTYVPPTPSFTKDLTLGMTDPEVVLLQRYLNTHGYILASTGVGAIGHESDYFGIETKRALIKYQKDNNITPAQGYFGPVTRSSMK